MQRQIDSLKSELSSKKGKAQPLAKQNKPVVTAKDINTYVRQHDRDKPMT